MRRRDLSSSMRTATLRKARRRVSNVALRHSDINPPVRSHCGGHEVVNTFMELAMNDAPIDIAAISQEINSRANAYYEYIWER